MSLENTLGLFNQIIVVDGLFAPYKVGDAYDVRDGHHRISVAKSMDQEAIEARIVNKVPQSWFCTLFSGR